ncbi:MAG: transcription termination/antitermination NusG family protein, partial [Candidatus Saccharicenans sp.]
MLKWFVVNTKSKKEFQVEKILTQAGFSVYNPKYCQDSKIKPFFPGYVFVRFSYPVQFQKIIYTRGIKKVVGNRLGPIPVGPEVISCLKSREKDGLIELMKYG